MQFLSPWYLLGALAVGVPIWVHLIRHERARPLPFASLMFFRRIPQPTVSRRRLKHLLLLAARCLLVLLIALAFARPYLSGPAAPAGLGPQARLFVLLADCSLSMQYGDRARRAADAARQALDRMGALDQAQLVAFDSEARVLNAPTSDRGVLRGLIDSGLRPGALPTNYAVALRALEKLAEAAKTPVSAFLISDFQKSGWLPGSAPLSLPRGTSLELMPVDQAARPNWSVSELAVSRDTFQGRYPRRLQVRVNGFQTAAANPTRTRKELALKINGREVARRAVEVPAGGAATAVFEGFELPPGASRGEIRLQPGDGLPQDDVRYFALVRREAGRVLYLTGSDSGREAAYLREALGAGEDPMFTLEPRPLAAAVSEPLESYAAIVLSNAGALPGRLGARLKEYVEAGGGLFLVLGDRTDWPALARALGALLPASGAEKAYVRRDAEQFITLGEFRRDHVIFQPFAETAAGGLLAARFFGYFRLSGAGDEAVLARFSTGEPALLARAAGRGRVLLLASSADNVWSDLPLHAGFVPFIWQALRFLAAAGDEPAAHTVPASVALAGIWGARATPESYSVLDPAGRRQQADERGGAGAPYARLTELGFYEVRYSRQTDYIAANPDPRESDLTPLSEEDRALLARTAGKGAAGAAAAAPRELEQRQNFWWMLLVLAAIVVVAESILGNNHLRQERAFEPPRHEDTKQHEAITL
jgi:hypothetical protein